MQMIRYCLALLCLSAIPFHAFALGLGEITVRSALSQPLEAEIALISVGDTDLDDIRITLADSIAFSNAGIDRPYFLTKLKFQTTDEQGSARILVSSVTSNLSFNGTLKSTLRIAFLSVKS